jgi:hypothetical protein
MRSLLSGQLASQEACPWHSDPHRRPAVTGIARVAGLPAAPSGWVRIGDLAPVLTAQRRPDQGDPSCLVMNLLPADGEEGGSLLRMPQRRPPHVGLCDLRIRFGHRGFVVAHAPVRTAFAPDSPDCRREPSGYEGSTVRAVANVGAKDRPAEARLLGGYGFDLGEEHAQGQAVPFGWELGQRLTPVGNTSCTVSGTSEHQAAVQLDVSSETGKGGRQIP